MTPEQEAKLPAYARQELRALRMRLLEAEAAAERARLSTKPSASRVIAGRYREPIGLGNEPVLFLTEAGADPVLSGIEVVPDPHGPGVRVMAARGPLIIEPAASNVAYIRGGDR